MCARPGAASASRNNSSTVPSSASWANTSRTSSLPYPSPTSASRTSERALVADEPGTTVRSRSGTASRAFRSTSNRCAVRLPTPGTATSASMSSSARQRRRLGGECTDRIASASFGPTPLAVISASNVSRSSRVGKPNRIRASSRTCWCVNKNVLAPGSRSAIALIGTSTRYPIPATSMRTSPLKLRSSTEPRTEPIMTIPPSS